MLYGPAVAFSVLVTMSALAGTISAEELVPGTVPTDLTAQDPPWSANHRVDDDTSGVQQMEVSLAADSNGVWYAGWIDSRGGCAYAGSADDGVTWSKNEIYKGKFRMCADPAVSADEKGNIFRLALSYDSSDGPSAIYISRSSDGAKSWSPWVIAAEVPAPQLTDKPWLSGDGDNIVVAWANFGSGVDVTVVSSQDAGQTWGSKQQPNGLQGTCLTVGVDGRFHLGYWSGSAIDYRSSEDGGKTWSTAVAIAPQMSQPTPGCDVDPSGKMVCWTWDIGGIMVNCSADGGTTWGTPVRADQGSSGAQLSWVAVDAQKKIHATWMDSRNGYPEAYGAVSEDGGKSFGTNERISDAPAVRTPSFIGHYTQSAYSSKGFVGYAWCDSRASSTNGDIYFATRQAAPPPPPEVVSVAVTPATVTLQAGTTQQFVAQAFDKDNNPLTATFSWTSTAGTISPAGLLNAPTKPGPVTVTATTASKSGTAAVTVIPGPLLALVVEPRTATITADDTQKFSVRGVDAFGNAVPVSPAWSATGGTVDTTGLYSPDKIGTYDVAAKDGIVVAVGSVTVTPGKVARVDVDPPAATVKEDESKKFSARAFDAKGNEVHGATYTWKVTGGIGVIDGTGLFTATHGGSGTVVATGTGNNGSAEGKADVIVTPLNWWERLLKFFGGFWNFMMFLMLLAAVLIAAIAVAARRRKKKRAVRAAAMSPPGLESPGYQGWDQRNSTGAQFSVPDQQPGPAPW